MFYTVLKLSKMWPCTTFVTLKIKIYFKVLIACVFSFSRVFLVRWIVIGPFAGFDTWENTCGLTQLQDNALNMYAIGFASQSIQTNAKLVHNGCYVSLCFFFNAPKKLPNQKIHRDVNIHFLCLFLSVLPKKLPNSEHFPHWRQLCVRECNIKWSVALYLVVKVCNNGVRGVPFTLEKNEKRRP